MNCPVCQKEIQNDLSVCFACGAMKNDSVREELAVKVTSSGRKQLPAIPQIIPQFSPLVVTETMSNANLKNPKFNSPGNSKIEFAASAPAKIPNLVEFQPKKRRDSRMAAATAKFSAKTRRSETGNKRKARRRGRADNRGNRRPAVDERRNADSYRASKSESAKRAGTHRKITANFHRHAGNRRWGRKEFRD